MASEQTDSTAPKASTDWRDLTDGLPQPLDDAERQDMLWQQLLAEFHWYNKAARKHRMAYQGMKILSIVLGGLVTVLAAVGAEAWLTASLAAAIVAAEGFQQLFLGQGDAADRGRAGQLAGGNNQIRSRKSLMPSSSPALRPGPVYN